MTSIIKVQNIQYTDGDAALTIADGGGVTAASSVAVTGDLTVDTNTLFVDASTNKVHINSTSADLDTSGFSCEFAGGNNYIAHFENTTNATIIPDGNRLNIAKMWFLDLYDKDYLNAHHHGGNLLSGIIYLKIPNVPKTSYPNGCIEFTYNPMVLPEKLINSNTFMLEPKEKQMYIWPSWLFHTVYPYYGNESRRSLSFNINIAPV